MAWIKLTHSTGADYLNIDQVYKIVQTAPNDLTFYDANSILPTTYIFSTAADLAENLAKFESITKIIDIDKLAPQG